MLAARRTARTIEQKLTAQLADARAQAAAARTRHLAVELAVKRLDSSLDLIDRLRFRTRDGGGDGGGGEMAAAAAAVTPLV